MDLLGGILLKKLYGNLNETSYITSQQKTIKCGSDTGYLRKGAPKDWKQHKWDFYGLFWVLQEQVTKKLKASEND
jgi:hypothetical protein